MEDWDFFMGGSDFGHFVPGADLPPHELSWFVSYIDSGATNLEICADNDYGYIFYSLPLLEGDSFGVDKISLKDGKKIWGRVYQKAINAQPCCHDEFVFAEGVFINKCDGSVIDFFSFPGCEEGLYYSFISEGKIFLSEKGVRAKGGFWCDLANLNEKEEFNGRIVCSLSDGRVVKSEGDCLYVFSSGEWRSNCIALKVALGEVVSFNNFIIVAKNGFHIFEVNGEGEVKKVNEYGLSIISDVSVLMRGDNCVVAYDAENGKAIIYDLENEKMREFFLQLDKHIVRSSCIRGSVLYGTFNDKPVGYSIASGERVWMSDYKISARTVVASRTAVLYKFIAGAVQGYSLKA